MVAFKYRLLTIVIAILSACENQDNRVIEYYQNGNIKSISETQDNSKHGITEVFYFNGNIKYSGTFSISKKVGPHFEYYEQDSGLVHYEVGYSDDLNENVLYKKIFAKDGTNTYSSTTVNKELLIKIEADTIKLGEVVNVSLSFPNQKYPFISASLVDTTLTTNNRILSNKVLGDKNIVKISILGERVGWNLVRGYLSDFDIIQINDTTGMTIAEETYFEFKFFVFINIRT